jgi:hypothetical protein
VTSVEKGEGFRNVKVKIFSAFQYPYLTFFFYFCDWFAAKSRCSFVEASSREEPQQVVLCDAVC